MPGWIETGHRVYDAAAPRIAEGGKQALAAVDRTVTPVLIEKEHELLGEENSAVLDKTLSGVASAGKMVAGMIGRVVSMGIEGGAMVARATPEMIEAGKQTYKTVDETIMPEVADATRKMKAIVDKTVPEVVDTSKHAYDTIMPEVMRAEEQIASTVRSGVDTAMPTLREIEKKVMPELARMEHTLLGDEQAALLEKTVAERARQGEDAIRTAEKTVPEVLASGQKTVESVASTGRTLARAVPVMVEAGKQTYNSVDRSIAEAMSTTQDIASDLDRAAGKTAYAIEGNLANMAGTIDKTLPSVLEAGRQVAVSGTDIAKTVESGSKAVIDDASGFIDDLKVDNTINSAAKRFAATKPVFQDFTALVQDPNELGKL